MIVFSGMRGAKFWTVASVAVCGLVLWNNTIYLDLAHVPRFFLEKGELAHQAWWLTAFCFHVAGASICLAAGIPLMLPGWTRRHPAWHRRIGYLYLNAVLWMAAPSGLLMAPVAKGGMWGAVGFALAGVAWWIVTWSGYRAIRRGDLPAHIRGMVRSYALALSAPAFRVIQVGLYYAGMEDGTNYVISLWLSILFSVWLSESFLYRRQSAAAYLKTGQLSPVSGTGVLS